MAYFIYNTVTKEVISVTNTAPENLEINYDYVEHSGLNDNAIGNYNIFVKGNALELSMKTVSEKTTYLLKEENEKLKKENETLKLALVESIEMMELNKIDFQLAIAEVYEAMFSS